MGNPNPGPFLDMTRAVAAADARGIKMQIGPWVVEGRLFVVSGGFQGWAIRIRGPFLNRTSALNVFVVATHKKPGGKKNNDLSLTPCPVHIFASCASAAPNARVASKNPPRIRILRI